MEDGDVVDVCGDTVDEEVSRVVSDDDSDNVDIDFIGDGEDICMFAYQVNVG